MFFSFREPDVRECVDKISSGRLFISGQQGECYGRRDIVSRFQSAMHFGIVETIPKHVPPPQDGGNVDVFS